MGCPTAFESRKMGTEQFLRAVQLSDSLLFTRCLSGGPKSQQEMFWWNQIRQRWAEFTGEERDAQARLLVVSRPEGQNVESPVSRRPAFVAAVVQAAMRVAEASGPKPSVRGVYGMAAR